MLGSMKSTSPVPSMVSVPPLTGVPELLSAHRWLISPAAPHVAAAFGVVGAVDLLLLPHADASNATEAATKTEARIRLCATLHLLGFAPISGITNSTVTTSPVRRG